jgi:hypothetical protein
LTIMGKFLCRIQLVQLIKLIFLAGSFAYVAQF